MSETEIDIEKLELMVARLAEGLDRYQRDSQNDLIRDGLIYRFKMAYFVGCATLKRYLKSVAGESHLIDSMPFQDVIRTGNEHQMLKGEWVDWKTYRETVESIEHASGEENAAKVVEKIPTFVEEIAYFRDKLRERLAGRQGGND